MPLCPSIKHAVICGPTPSRHSHMTCLGVCATANSMTSDIESLLLGATSACLVAGVGQAKSHQADKPPLGDQYIVTTSTHSKCIDSLPL